MPACLLAIGLAACDSDKAADTGPADDKAKTGAASKGADSPDAAAGATGAAAASGADAAAPPAGTGQAEPEAAPEGPDVMAQLAELEPVGIEFCDSYLEAYRKCITFTVPEGERAAHAETLVHEFENWTRTKAGAPDVAQSALEIGCRSAQAQAAQKTRALNCAW